MPFPLKLALIPALKILLLGFLKTVFILIGALFFPAFTLRVMVNGAVGILLPLIHWLRDAEHIDMETMNRWDLLCGEMREQKYSRTEARSILMTMVRDTITGMRTALQNMATSWANRTRSLINKFR